MAKKNKKGIPEIETEKKTKFNQSDPSKDIRFHRGKSKRERNHPKYHEVKTTKHQCGTPELFSEESPLCVDKTENILSSNSDCDSQPTIDHERLAIDRGKFDFNFKLTSESENNNSDEEVHSTKHYESRKKLSEELLKSLESDDELSKIREMVDSFTKKCSKNATKTNNECDKTPRITWTPISYNSETKRVLDELSKPDESINRLIANNRKKTGTSLRKNRKLINFNSQSSTSWFKADNGFEDFENDSRQKRKRNVKKVNKEDKKCDKQKSKLEIAWKKKKTLKNVSQLTFSSNDVAEPTSSKSEKIIDRMRLGTDEVDAVCVNLKSITSERSCDISANSKFKFDSDSDDCDLPVFEGLANNCTQESSSESELNLRKKDTEHFPLESDSDDCDLPKFEGLSSNDIQENDSKSEENSRTKDRERSPLSISNSKTTNSQFGSVNSKRVSEQKTYDTDSDDSDLPVFDVKQIHSSEDNSQTVSASKLVLQARPRNSSDADMSKEGWKIREEIRSTEKLKDLTEEHLNYLLRTNHNYLKDIFRGKLYSDRHQDYVKGGRARIRLVDRVFLSLYTDAQVEFVLQKLPDVTGKYTAKFVDYIFKVLLPEALIKMLMDFKSLPHKDAENMLFLGGFEELE